MMGQRSLMVAMVFCVTLAFLPVSAWGLCEQAELAGTWSVEVWGGSEGGINCWDMCTLTIGADGAIAPGGSYTDCHGVNSDVTGGQLTMSSKCLVEGTIITSSGTIVVGPGAITGNGQMALGTEQ